MDVLAFEKAGHAQRRWRRWAPPAPKEQLQLLKALHAPII